DRMGMVLRRSTTRWTWVRDFRRSVRSRVTFMASSKVAGIRSVAVGAGSAGLRQAWRIRLSARTANPGRTPSFGAGFASGGRSGAGEDTAPKGLEMQGGAFHGAPARRPYREVASSSDVEHALQQLDLLGQHAVGLGQLLNLAHGVQDRGVVAVAEAAADLGQ